MEKENEIQSANEVKVHLACPFSSELSSKQKCHFQLNLALCSSGGCGEADPVSQGGPPEADQQLER